MNIIYAGTPEFAVPPLQSLIDSDHQVVAVYTQPDRPAGRGRKLQVSPVKQCALDHGIAVEQPLSFKQIEAVDRLVAYQPDLMVVAAYGLILPQVVLDAPRLGCINIHASLLPRWRGAAPIQRAILAGDSQTGITLMQMDAGLDTGDMLATATVAIASTMTAAELHDALKQVGADLLMQNLPAIEAGSLPAHRQNDQLATYAAKLSKQEALIDWHKSASALQREIRAFNPWPVSYTQLDHQPVKIWSASVRNVSCTERPGRVFRHDKDGIHVCCGEGVLCISELQFAGKNRHSAEQVLNARNLTHEIFGC